MKFFYGPMRFDNDDWLARIIVKQLTDERYELDEARFYNLDHKKTKKLTSKPDASAKAGAPESSELLKISIDHLASAVKEKYPKHIKPDW